MMWTQSEHDRDTKRVLITGALCVIGLFAWMIYDVVQDNRAWDSFLVRVQQHHCKIVDDNWQCDDGPTYWSER